MTAAAEFAIRSFQDALALYDSGQELDAMESFAALAANKDVVPAIGECLQYLLSNLLLQATDLLSSGRIPEVEEIIRRINNSRLRYPSLKLVEAMLLQQKGQIPEALAALEEELQYFPTNETAKILQENLLSIGRR